MGLSEREETREGEFRIAGLRFSLIIMELHEASDEVGRVKGRMRVSRLLYWLFLDGGIYI